MTIVTRTFSLADQQAFAELSGDFNPMHLDQSAARRLMLGGVAVHGVHLILWVMDSLAASGVALGSLRSIRAHFERPAGLGEEITAHWQISTGKIVAVAEGRTGRVMRLTLQPGQDHGRAWTGSRVLPTLACRDNRMEDIATQSGSLDLALPMAFARQFPNLGVAFSPREAAVLLASTRLVGMICPGLHSIFSGLSVEFIREPETSGALEYMVTKADPRVRLIDISVRGAGCEGRLETFLRPEPVAQPGFAALKGTVPAGRFSGQRALVIGGSRGLGELTAKLLASGGADVTVTYFNGAEDAARMAGEAAALGYRMNVLHFDVGAPPDEAPEFAANFTHAYYFATPRIAAAPHRGFSAAMFARYIAYYVTGFAQTVEWLRPRAVSDLCIWYPSSVFVEIAPPGLAEYAAAKACGEALCAQLSTRLAPARAVADRLPRLATDQTQSLAPLELADAVDVLRSILLRLA